MLFLHERTIPTTSSRSMLCNFIVDVGHTVASNLHIAYNNQTNNNSGPTFTPKGIWPESFNKIFF